MDNARFKSQRKSKTRGYVLLISFAGALLLTLLMYSVVWCWYELQHSDFFKIQHIQINTKIASESNEQIQQVVSSHLKGGFFSLNLEPVKKALLQNPWVTKVSFTRIWPDTLVVSLVEREAMARWGSKGIVTVGGEIFYPDPETIPKSLPNFVASDDDVETVVGQYQAVSKLLKPLNLYVKNLFLSDQGDWKLTLSNDIEVQLGSSDVLPRFERLVHVYNKLRAMAPRPVATIDLRYPHGFAVTYVPPAS